jgi:D-inositol-3-phosphate glycosyltransferase
VVWTGALPHSQALTHLALSDVVAVPSQWEGFGLAAVEAMALGKPVVASNVGGLAEVVTDGQNGLLVPAGDVGRLAAALGRLLQDRAARERLGQTALNDVKRFSFRRFSEQYLGLYSALGKV